MEIVCCGEPMKLLGGARRCVHCGKQHSGNPNVIAPTHVYVQPDTAARPLSHQLPGAMGISRNREEN